MKPRVCIIKTEGTNCDVETAHALALAGGEPKTVLLSQLKTKRSILSDFEILVLPGGFSYGDDIAGGKILALELQLFLKEQVQEFVVRQKLIIGICNGFQALLHAQLLPGMGNNQKQVTLMRNDSGRFECRWSPVRIERSRCVFTKNLSDQECMLPVAHAEGKFFAAHQDIEQLEQMNSVALRYTKNGNPNGSVHDVAGICDETGRIFGLMPHPERFIYSYQHPERTRKKMEPLGLQIFKNGVEYLL